jgi:hypothetical protein
LILLHFHLVTVFLNVNEINWLTVKSDRLLDRHLFQPALGERPDQRHIAAAVRPETVAMLEKYRARNGRSFLESTNAPGPVLAKKPFNRIVLYLRELPWLRATAKGIGASTRIQAGNDYGKARSRRRRQSQIGGISVHQLQLFGGDGKPEGFCCRYPPVLAFDP